MSYSQLIVTLVLVLVAIYAVVTVGWRWASRRFLSSLPELAELVTTRWLRPDWWAATQRTLDRIGLAPGNRVLEIGPGPGRLLIPAAARVRPGGTVVGLDVQPGMIEQLQKRSAGIDNLSIQLGNAEDMPFAESHFDVVYLAMVLGEIPDLRAERSPNVFAC